MTGATGCLAQPGSTLTHNLCIKFKEKSAAAKIKSRKCFTCAPLDCQIQGSSHHQQVRRRSPTIGGHIPGPQLGKRNWVDFLCWAMATAIGNIRERKYALLAWVAGRDVLYQKCWESGVIGRCIITGYHPFVLRRSMMMAKPALVLDSSQLRLLLWYVSLVDVRDAKSDLKSTDINLAPKN